MPNNRAKLFILFLTVLVLGLVVFMYSGFGIIRDWFDIRYPNFDKTILPLLNAVLNSLVAISLLLAFKAIKAKKVEIHQRYVYIAMGLSTAFLINYVFYHMISETTKYGGEGVLKAVYLFILLTHIVLAAISFPFIIYTLYLGQTKQLDAHRKIAKRVFPIWLYVAITGVVVYGMISPYY